MIVLGLDVEATGLDIDNDNVVELGLVQWDTDAQKPMQLISILIDDCGEISEESQKIHGISKDDCLAVGMPLCDAWKILNTYWAVSERIIAHNGKQFDLPLLKKCYERHIINWTMNNVGGCFFDPSNWIDTMTDIPYPDSIHSRNLRHLAADHGFLNPFAHRAVFDVLTMMTIMSKYDFNTILEMSLEPMFPIYAICSKPWEDNGISTDAAKKGGFKWDGAAKIWTKQIRERQWEAEQQKATAYKLKRL